MKKWRNGCYLWIAVALLTGVLSGLLSMDGMSVFRELVDQPPLSPPGAVFPVVWTILYALMGYGAARICQKEDSPQKSLALNLFVTQLVVNFFWSLIFFNLQRYGFSFFWLLLLWVLVLLMIICFARVDKTAALLQIPYLAWLTFAVYLSAGVWVLN